MLNAFLGFILLALALFAVVQVVMALSMLIDMILNVFVRLLSGLGQVVTEAILLPIKIARMGLTPDQRRPRVRALPGVVRLGTICGNSRCRSASPAGARFCRRCGRGIAGIHA